MGLDKRRPCRDAQCQKYTIWFQINLAIALKGHRTTTRKGRREMQGYLESHTEQVAFTNSQSEVVLEHQKYRALSSGATSLLGLSRIPLWRPSCLGAIFRAPRAEWASRRN